MKPTLTLAFLLAAGAVAGCSLYRSSDRDYFDSHARAGAPSASAALLATNCKNTSKANDLMGLDLSSDPEAFSIDHSGDSTSTVWFARRLEFGAENFLVCKFDFATVQSSSGPSTAQDTELIEASRSVVENHLKSMNAAHSSP